MRRRALLLAVAGSTAAASLISARSLTVPGLLPPELRDYEVRDGSEVEYRPSLVPAPTAADDVPTTLLATVGDRSDVFLGDHRGPHDVVVVNDADTSRRLSIALSVGGDRIFERTPTLAAGTGGIVGLLEPAEYVLHVGVPGDTEQIPLDADSFDCNASATYVSVGPDGSVESSTSTTTAGCSWLSDL